MWPDPYETLLDGFGTCDVKRGWWFDVQDPRLPGRLTEQSHPKIDDSAALVHFAILLLLYLTTAEGVWLIKPPSPMWRVIAFEILGFWSNLKSIK